MATRTAVGRLVQLGLLVAVGYLAVARGWPYLKQRLAAAEAMAPAHTIAADEAGRCLDHAGDTIEVFDENLDAFLAPPVSEHAWGAFVRGVQEHVVEARRECAACSDRPCYHAMEAVDGVDGVIAQLDVVYRRDGAVPEPRERREIIRQQLREARGEY